MQAQGSVEGMLAEPLSILRRLAGGLPPTMRRRLSGLWLDLLSLPARIREPSRRSDPWQAIHNVGGGDYRAIGEHLMNLLTDRADLTPSSRVLDIGCGTGRLAEPLARALSPEGAYTGFDVAWAGVEECRRRLADQRPDFVFVHADLANTEYNASGRNSEQGYHFPAESSRVDVAVATSVFSHMRLESVAAYLAEAARVLAPEGRFVFTAYALTTERRACSNLKPFGASSQVLDLSSPERMIAHDADALEAAITAAGLQLLQREFGTWALGATYDGLQDLYVAVRA